MKKVSYALIASALFASSASAGLTTSSSSAHLANPAACANFNGFFAGALLGYGSGKTRLTGKLAGEVDASFRSVVFRQHV